MAGSPAMKRSFSDSFGSAEATPGTGATATTSVSAGQVPEQPVFFTASPAKHRPFTFALAQLMTQTALRPTLHKVAWSSRNLIAFACPHASETTAQTTLGRMHSILIVDANAPSTAVAVLASVHQSMPTILTFHPSGTILLTGDELGRIVVWKMQSSASVWVAAYQVDLHESVAALTWFPNERTMHTAPVSMDAVKIDDDRLKGTYPTAVEGEDLGPINPFGNIAFAALTTSSKLAIAMESQLSPNLLVTERYLAGQNSKIIVAHADFCVILGRIVVAMHIQSRISAEEVIVYDISASVTAHCSTVSIDAVPNGAIQFSQHINNGERLVGLGFLRRKSVDLRLYLVFSQGGANKLAAPTEAYSSRLVLYESVFKSVPIHPAFSFDSVAPEKTSWNLQFEEVITSSSFFVGAQLDSDFTALGLLFADGSVQLRNAVDLILVSSVSATDGPTPCEGNMSLTSNELPVVSIAFSPNHGALVQVFASGELRVILLPNVALLPFTSLMTKTPLPEPGTETNEIVLAYSYTLLAALERATDPWDLLKLLSYYAFQCDLTPSDFVDRVAVPFSSYYRMHYREVESRMFWSMLMRIFGSVPSLGVCAMDSYAVVQILFIHDVLLSHLPDPVSSINRTRELLATKNSPMDYSKLNPNVKFDPAHFWSLIPLVSYAIDYTIFACYNANAAVMRVIEPIDDVVQVDRSIPGIGVLVSLEPQFALFHTLVMSFHLLTQVQQKKTETTNPAEYQLYSNLERLLHRPNFSLQLLIEKLYHLPQLERGAIYYPLKLTADQVRGVRAALSSTLPVGAGNTAPAPAPFSREGVEGKIHLIRQLQEHLELAWQEPVDGKPRLDVAYDFVNGAAPHAFSVEEPSTTAVRALPSLQPMRNDVVRHTKFNPMNSEVQKSLQCLRCYRFSSVQAPKASLPHSTVRYSVARECCICGGLWSSV